MICSALFLQSLATRLSTLRLGSVCMLMVRPTILETTPASSSLTATTTATIRSGPSAQANCSMLRLASVWTWMGTTTTRWRCTIASARSGSTGTRRGTPSETTSMTSVWMSEMVTMLLCLTVMDPTDKIGNWNENKMFQQIITSDLCFSPSYFEFLINSYLSKK